MAKTTQFFTSPAPGTKIPVRQYTEEQKAQINALGEVRYSYLPFL